MTIRHIFLMSIVSLGLAFVVMPCVSTLAIVNKPPRVHAHVRNGREVTQLPLRGHPIIVQYVKQMAALLCGGCGSMKLAIAALIAGGLSTYALYSARVGSDNVAGGKSVPCSQNKQPKVSNIQSPALVICGSSSTQSDNCSAMPAEILSGDAVGIQGDIPTVTTDMLDTLDTWGVAASDSDQQCDQKLLSALHAGDLPTIKKLISLSSEGCDQRVLLWSYGKERIVSLLD
jgi:hypothetical protein